MKKLFLVAIIILFATASYAGSLAKRPVEGTGLGYFYAETLATGVTSDAVVIPPLKVGQKNVTVTMINGGNTGSIEFTTSSDALVTSGGATWQTWPLGVVTGTTSDALIGPVTALRGKSALGEVKYEIVY